MPVFLCRAADVHWVSISVGWAKMVEHGGRGLAEVTLDTYNAELRDSEGFIGDRASMRAFAAMLDDERERIRGRDGADPLGEAGEQPDKRVLDQALAEGDLDAAGLILGTIETFAREFAGVIRKLLRLPGWQGTERIAVGGGMRDSRVGKLAIGRTSVLLQSDEIGVQLAPIWHHPDEAGLIGAVGLAPVPILEGCDSILAVDIGGTKMRAGCVLLERERSADLSCAHVAFSDLWKHADDRPNRDDATQRLIAMLDGLERRAQAEGHRPAPFIGVGCPGLIRADGTIERGGQNLPGNWEDKSFSLPSVLGDALALPSGERPMVVMHNDAVVQGLSEVSRMRDVDHWGILTIGTGLGNARFSRG